jgi:hypothetical protein
MRQRLQDTAPVGDRKLVCALAAGRLMLTDALEIHFVDMAKFRKLREKDIGLVRQLG